MVTFFIAQTQMIGFRKRRSIRYKLLDIEILQIYIKFANRRKCNKTTRLKTVSNPTF